ncbi:MAG: alanine--tRNA ligase [Bacteroidota bacterium]|nr:alanine--tRNA ligase [Bacteroidota bacterium]|tara:strand:- start:1764 stop:4382 length:2619 start_codon:yes stop_codon:yes gene_type:complete
MNSQTIRNKFLDFFISKNHKIHPSAPIISKNDPSLMFVNSGMAPFKEFFLGESISKNSRIANSQKCLRVSGKHNDLEEVGIDTYHHTFFEMLGNWSFGDYFKQEAIEWSWELLTKVYEIDPENLYVTIFSGSNKDDVPLDTEAFEIWKKIIPVERILNFGKKDNFWEMGEQGPCGPCSEIHIDLRSEKEKKKVPGRDLVNKDHPKVVELWNLVFIQYNRKANGKLEDLPKKHIDTGMGFERLCMVVQGVDSNYSTDVFTPIIREIETITGFDYGKDKNIDIAMRVISDHLRAVSFSISDGQLPSNTGAGYVIRRILRRAIRYAFTFLEKKEPFIYRLVGVLVKKMGDSYPEIKSQRKLIENVIKEEESSFLKTLDQGLVLLDEIINSSKKKMISGEKAFELYDTFGFPVDLTSLILNEKGFKLDIKGFEKELENQKNRSRAASEKSVDDWIVLIDDPVQEFIGYDSLDSKVKLVKYRKVVSSKDGELYQLVFNLTPFYAESGGQVGDKGYLESPNGDIIYITDTIKEGNLSVHIVKNLPKNMSETFNAVVDKKQRFRTQCNHTATHLLHQALREVLGEHVQQKGSRVSSDHLRFDFSHFSKVNIDQLSEIENFVNSRIDGKLDLEEQRNVPIDKAISNGAIALFDEKYGDTVRTVKFGNSYELCGGTHVRNTSDIWQFKIKSEGAIASGIRRIEAITFDSVKEYYADKETDYNKTKKLLNNSGDIVKSISDLIDENNRLRKERDKFIKEKTNFIKDEIKSEIKEKKGIKFISKNVSLDPSAMKDLIFSLGNELDNLFAILISEYNSKVYISCYISKELSESKNYDAREVINELSIHVKANGGGQAFYATAGGDYLKGVDKLSKASSNYHKNI